jgi:hypothetical protein
MQLNWCFYDVQVLQQIVRTDATYSTHALQIKDILLRMW